MVLDWYVDAVERVLMVLAWGCLIVLVVWGIGRLFPATPPAHPKTPPADPKQPVADSASHHHHGGTAASADRFRGAGPRGADRSRGRV